MFQVLVVEDDTILRELFCNVLTDHGYTPVPARDGLEAFDILDDTHIDLIITDSGTDPKVIEQFREAGVKVQVV